MPCHGILLVAITTSFTRAVKLGGICTTFVGDGRTGRVSYSSTFFSGLRKLLASCKSIGVRVPFQGLSGCRITGLKVRLRTPVKTAFSYRTSPSVPYKTYPGYISELGTLGRLDLRSVGRKWAFDYRNSCPCRVCEWFAEFPASYYSELPL